MGMFKGLASAKVNMGRLPDPSVGVADYLIESLRMRLSDLGEKRYEVRLVSVNPLTADGTATGTRCQFCMFPAKSAKNAQFAAAEMKRLLLALADVRAEDEEDVVEMMCPLTDKENAKLSEEDRADKAWDLIFMQAFCVGEDEKPSEGPGSFDGQVVLRIETVAREAGGDTVYTQDKETGKMVAVPKKVFINHYPKFKVTAAEAAEGLTPQQIKQVFGSVESYEELVAAEAAVAG